MRKSILTLAFLFCSGMLLSQQNAAEISKGDILILGQASGTQYQNIEFPRKHIILKRGAIADFKSLVGKQLIVHSIETDKYGTDIAILKRKDGLDFFRFFPKVKADIYKAIASEELKIMMHKGLNAIAQ